jgi:hypothetical protein
LTTMKIISAPHRRPSSVAAPSTTENRLRKFADSEALAADAQ